MKRIFWIALALAVTFSAEAQTSAPVLYRILLAPDGQTLQFQLDNAGSDPSGLDVLLNGTSYLAGGSFQSTAKRLAILSGSTNLFLTDFLQVAGTFSLNKSHTEYVESSGVQTVSDGTTAAIKVRRGAEVYLKQASSHTDITLTTGAGKESIVLKANTTLDSRTSVSQAQRVYSLRVNGSTVALTPQDGSIALGTYAVNGDTITFPADNLRQRVNSVALLVDGIPTNSFAFMRRTDWLREINRVEYKLEAEGPVMRVFLTKNSSLYDISQMDVLMDGSTIAKTDTAIFGNDLVVKIPVTRFAPGVKSVTFQVRDPVTGLTSDAIAINIEKDFRFVIPSVTLTVIGNETVVRIPNEAGSLFGLGQPGNFSITWNGLKYTPQGTQETSLNASGAALLDSNGTPLTHTVRQTNFTLGAGFVEFRLPTSVLTDANTLVWHNNTLNWVTPAFSFDRSGVPVATAPVDIKPEKASFIPADALEKRLDFVNQDIGTFKLGSLTLENLDPNAAYELSLSVYSNADINPFSDFSYAGEPLQTVKDTKGNAAFHYFRRAKGSELAAAGDFVWAPSGVRSQSPVALTIGDILLKKVDAKSQYTTLLSLPTAGTASVKWIYDFGTCWDGGTQGCEVTGLSDPFLQVTSSALASASAIASVSPAPEVVLVAPAPVANEQKSLTTTLASLSTSEVALTRVQRTQALSLVSRLADAILRISHGDISRARRNGQVLVTMIEARLSQVADASRRALLREVARQLKVRF